MGTPGGRLRIASLLGIGSLGVACDSPFGHGHITVSPFRLSGDYSFCCRMPCPLVTLVTEVSESKVFFAPLTSLSSPPLQMRAAGRVLPHCPTSRRRSRSGGRAASPRSCPPWTRLASTCSRKCSSTRPSTGSQPRPRCRWESVRYKEGGRGPLQPRLRCRWACAVCRTRKGRGPLH